MPCEPQHLERHDGSWRAALQHPDSVGERTLVGARTVMPIAAERSIRPCEGVGQPGIRRARSNLGPVPQLPVGAVHAVNAADSPALMDHAAIVRAAIAGRSEDERADMPQCSFCLPVWGVPPAQLDSSR
jgi:hypothetical protein